MSIYCSGVRRAVGVGRSLSLLAIAMAGSAIATESEAEQPMTNQSATNQSVTHNVELVARYLTGVMQTEVPPNETRTEALVVEMRTCPIEFDTQNKSGVATPAIALYQEQAITTSPDSPYRQRVLLLSEKGGLVESFGYRLADEERWASLCDRAERSIVVDDLGEATCGLRLEREGEMFRGETPEGSCPSNYRGATYSQST